MEQFGARGTLSIVALPFTPDEHLTRSQLDRFINRSGAEQLVLKKNLITDLGLSALSRLLGGGVGTPSISNGVDVIGFTTLEDMAVTKMVVDNDNAPTPPDPSDNDISNPPEFMELPLSITYPSTSSINFGGVMPQLPSGGDPDFNGQQFTEEALFLANGALFARIVFPAIVKFATHALQFDHTIDMTRV